MANMSLKKNPMPSQDPNVRNKNFDEVALGYTEEQALDEATRCLNCKNKPCMQGCPVMVHIPDFIAEVAKGDFEAAYQIIAATSQELARMHGGDNITETTLASAEEQLRACEKFKQERIKHTA